MKLWGYQNGDDYFYFGEEETKALKGKVACLEPQSSLEEKTKAFKVCSPPVTISTPYNIYFPIIPPLDHKSISLLPCPTTVQGA